MFTVQFVTRYAEHIGYLDSVRIALEGGCRWIQLRVKNASDAEVETLAVEALALCREYKATFIIDDRVALVKKLHADGVHLGKNDMPVAEARSLLGDAFLIGGTANTFNDLKAHVENGADYIGCGPFRYTTTKEKLSPILGLDGYRNILSQMKKCGIDIPVVGIGGVAYEDIPDLKSVGLNGIALSGSVLRAEDPVAEMRRIIEFANK